METFDKNLANQLDTATLQAAWESITLTLGDYVGHVSTEHEIIQQYFVVTVIEAYQESGVKITFSYNDENETIFLNTPLHYWAKKAASTARTSLCSGIRWAVG